MSLSVHRLARSVELRQSDRNTNVTEDYESRWQNERDETVSVVDELDEVFVGSVNLQQQHHEVYCIKKGKLISSCKGLHHSASEWFVA